MFTSMTSTGATPGLRSRCRTAVLVGVALVSVACATPHIQQPEETADVAELRAAGGLVERYLRAAGDPDSADRGWSLLHPDLQQQMFGGDELAYLRAVAADDWTRFDWSVGAVIAEDEGLYWVYLDVADHAVVPEFLTAPSNNLSILGRLDPRQEPHIDVRVGLGGTGIWGKGG